MKQVPRIFFQQDTVKVAKELVGKLLEIDKKRYRILETEAYKQDKASHAKKRTKRSELMFDTHAHIYVYLIYGMYYCLNITTDKIAGAVLIRKLDCEKCDGPGKLCKKLKISIKDNGQPLGKRFKVLDDKQTFIVKKAPRIGIKEDTHLLWRFSLKLDSNK